MIRYSDSCYEFEGYPNYVFGLDLQCKRTIKRKQGKEVYKVRLFEIKSYTVEEIKEFERNKQQIFYTYDTGRNITLSTEVRPSSRIEDYLTYCKSIGISGTLRVFVADVVKL